MPQTTCRNRVRALDETRFSALSQALLRINASLDLDTVLHEVVDAACALTDARYGFLVTVDEAGEPVDFVTSGLTQDEHERIAEWPDGPKLFEQLRDLSGPYTLSDFEAFARSFGATWTREAVVPHVAMCTPVHHLGAQVGSFFIGDKRSESEFTKDDEEVLLLFATQAAAPIVNARTFRSAQRARDGLEALVETSPIGVLVIDAKTGQLLVFNREARRLFEDLCILGWPDEDPLEIVEGATCRLSTGREFTLNRTTLLQELNTIKVVRAEELFISNDDGDSVSALVNATPVHTEDGAIDYVVITLQDLAALEALDRMRADFLGMVSHEMRAPLAAIKGSTATVLNTSQTFAPTETQQFFRIIDEQADRMSSLISDLLDVGRITTGTLSVAPEATTVGELVEESRTALLSADDRHTLLVDLPTDLPHVMVDRGRIIQVLNNLLVNAARHSPISSPIRIAAIQENTHVAITVSDKGHGLSPERLARLFRRHTDSNTDEQGVQDGLGLAICKGLVEAHGGRIRAESPGPGQGLRVTFTVPVAGSTDATKPLAPHRRSASQSPEERPRVLVVDDDPMMLRFVRDALLRANYTPVVTGDHQEIRNLIDKENPVLVVLDLVLPGKDGIELIESIPELADLPVIFISGYGRDETIARALAAGAEDYIVKPFSPTELIARIEAALHRRSEPNRFSIGELTIDYELRQVTVAGKTVDLTATEYEVLRVLSLGQGRVSTYDTLLRQVWHGRAHANRKLVRAYVKRLRRKLGDDTEHPAYLVTERGVGYRFMRQAEL